jgi:hypothetical protein
MVVRDEVSHFLSPLVYCFTLSHAEDYRFSLFFQSSVVPAMNRLVKSWNSAKGSLTFKLVSRFPERESTSHLAFSHAS